MIWSAPFMHMVDDLTPYYQDRMRQLPPGATEDRRVPLS